MRTASAHPVRASAGWNLAQYSALLDRMGDWLESMRVLILWRDVFGETLSFDGRWLVDLENEFANRVYQELFPVEIDALNFYLEADEDPFNGCIPLSGWRIPWEVCDTSDLEDYQVPIAELILDAREENGGPAWLRADALDAVVEANLARIATSGEYMAGLADLVRLALCTRSYNNPFLDLPSAAIAYEYMDWDTPYYWVPEDIRTLTRLFNEVRPVVERILAFKLWFDTHGVEADGAVLRAMWGMEPPADLPVIERLIDMPELVSEGGEIDHYGRLSRREAALCRD